MVLPRSRALAGMASWAVPAPGRLQDHDLAGAAPGQLRGPDDPARNRRYVRYCQQPCPSETAPARRSSRHTATRCRDDSAGTRTTSTSHRPARPSSVTPPNVPTVTNIGPALHAARA